MTETVTQPSAKPTQKWIAGTSTGAAVTVLLWVAESTHVDLPLPVAGALVVLASGVAGYIKKNRRVRGTTPGTDGVAQHGA